MDVEKDYSECPLCEKTYRTEYLDKHMKKVHPPDYETVVCKHCQKSYKTKNHLHDHVRKIHNKNRDSKAVANINGKEKCQHCGKLLANKHCLQNHIRRVHNRTKHKKFECDYCAKTFPYKELIQKHIMNVHCDTKMVTCEKCFNKYKSSYINEHKRRVHPIGVGSECDVCHNIYKTKRLLRVHMQIMHNFFYSKVTRRMYTSSLKSKGKGNNNMYAAVHPKNNLEVVTKEGFECSHCHYTFNERFQLLRHLRMLLTHEIFEELELDDNLDETASYGTENSQDIIDCNSNDSKKCNAEIKLEASREDFFMDTDNFLFEIKQEIKEENDLEIGPVILQRPDLFNK